MIIEIIIVALFAVSIMIQLMIGNFFTRLIRETENMATTGSYTLRQCKRKFTAYYKLNGGVLNVPVFVDRYINKMTIGPIMIPTLKHLSGQTMLLSVFAAGVGACRGIIAGVPVMDILPYYILSMFGLYVYFSVSAMVDMVGKRKVLKTNMVDYLENNLMSRLDSLEEDLKTIEVPVVSPKEEKRFRIKGRERELEELLQEFLA